MLHEEVRRVRAAGCGRVRVCSSAWACLGVQPLYGDEVRMMKPIPQKSRHCSSYVGSLLRRRSLRTPN